MSSRPSQASRRATRAAQTPSETIFDDDPEDALPLIALRSAAGIDSSCQSLIRRVSLRGRIVARRKFHTTLFVDLVAGSSESVQLVLDDLTDGDGELLRVRMITLGSLVSVEGEIRAGRTARGRFSLFLNARCIQLVRNFAGILTHGIPSGPGCSQRSPRFQLVPSTVRWERALSRLNVDAHNTLAWRGGWPIPVAPASVPQGGRSGREHGRCLLLPASDAAAHAIAAQQVELRQAGWRLLTCSVTTVRRLSNKALLREHAARLGLLAHLPRHYDDAETAEYPCVLKRAEGEYGRTVHLVHSIEEARRRSGRRSGGGVACREGDGVDVGDAGSEDGRGDEGGASNEGGGANDGGAQDGAQISASDGDHHSATRADTISGQWLLMELVPSRVELSASMLVRRGQIVREAVVEYMYDADVYVYAVPSPLPHRPLAALSPPAELRRAGSPRYLRSSAHGFGLTGSWARPCAAWLEAELGLASRRHSGCTASCEPQAASVSSEVSAQEHTLSLHCRARDVFTILAPLEKKGFAIGALSAARGFARIELQSNEAALRHVRDRMASLPQRAYIHVDGALLARSPTDMDAAPSARAPPAPSVALPLVSHERGARAASTAAATLAEVLTVIVTTTRRAPRRYTRRARSSTRSCSHSLTTPRSCARAACSSRATAPTTCAKGKRSSSAAASSTSPRALPTTNTLGRCVRPLPPADAAALLSNSSSSAGGMDLVAQCARHSRACARRSCSLCSTIVSSNGASMWPLSLPTCSRAPAQLATLSTPWPSTSSTWTRSALGSASLASAAMRQTSGASRGR